MGLLRRTSKGIERGGQVLADTADVTACLKLISETIGGLVPEASRGQLLAALGLTAGAAGAFGTLVGAAVPIVVLATLIACRVRAAASEREARTQDLRFQERTVAHLKGLSDRLESVFIKQAAVPTAEGIAKVMREEIDKQRNAAVKELGLTDNEARDLTSQLALLVADLRDFDHKIDLISDDVGHRPWLELRRPVPGKPDLFLYRDMAIPFVGRHEEWGRLTDFLDSDAPFSWWRIIDPGGTGKSRIALELCWHSFAGGWTAGFLQPTAPETWSRWRVTNDTLIVVDYVFARWEPAALAQIVDQIAQYRGPHRVRLLVLERSDSGPWWRSFARSESSGAARSMAFRQEDGVREAAADRHRYGEALTLPPLGEEALGDLLRFVLAEQEVEPDAAELAGHVERFLRLDPKGRPLFAAFYADAVARDPNRPDWSLKQIAESVIEQKLLREFPGGEGQAPVRLDARHLNLLVLATLVGGVSLDPRRETTPRKAWEEAPETVSMADALAIDGLAALLPAKRHETSGEWVHAWNDRQAALIGGYGGYYDDDDPYIPELQPDPLGEAFVLERLAGHATAPGELAPDARRATESLLVAAGDLAPRYLSAWIDRARQDYPEECAQANLDLRAYQRVAIWDAIPLGANRWTRLEHLDLARITGYSLMPELVGRLNRRLSLTQVSDVSPLAGLAGLQMLDLEGTQVSDVSPLAGLAALQELYLSGTQVSDVSPLAGLAALQELYLDGTQVADLSPLVGLVLLKTLDLMYTRVSDVSPLAGLAALQELYLSGTQVSDVSPLAGLAALQTLSLDGTQVSDVSPLARLAALQTLYLPDTQVSDVSPLAGLPRLTDVWLPDRQEWNPQEGPPPEPW